MPITPNIIQTAKQTVKAQVVMSRTDRLPVLAMPNPDFSLANDRESVLRFPPYRYDYDSDIMTHIRESARRRIFCFASGRGYANPSVTTLIKSHRLI
jgi:hypothetical protein